jgi:hypothetical protein
LAIEQDNIRSGSTTSCASAFAGRALSRGVEIVDYHQETFMIGDITAHASR